MTLAIMIITALVASALITGFIKDRAYRDIVMDEIEAGVVKTDVLFTALGVIIISNLVPFTLGALIGLYAIL
ncbi:hypothetical protein EB001_20530 [bacterium]|nr:hypothetical protein [bacterium]